MTHKIGFKEYLAEIARFADDFNRKSEGIEMYISHLKGACAEAEACVSFRRTTATQSEMEKIAWMVDVFGWFADPDKDRRKIWYLFMNDVTFAAERRALEQACEPYTLKHSLFMGAPELFKHIRCRAGTKSPDLELIEDCAVESIDGSEIYKVAQGYSELLPELDKNIVNWARANFPNAPRFLRLNPWKFYFKEPRQKLMEAALVPANPRWMNTLSLFPNGKTYASYIVQDCNPKDNIEQYRDYHLRHIRRLEVTAQRKKKDYLSMMLEEIVHDDSPNDLMVCRCIHLDTHAVAGTPMKQAQLQHLDLAINVYQGAARKKRMADSLQNGKVCDASFRTHLFRIEKIPFPALFIFASMFLKSQYLYNEWITQLGVTIPPTENHLSPSESRNDALG